MDFSRKILSVLLSAALVSQVSVSHAATKTVTVPAGTPVQLKLAKDVSTDTQVAGDLIGFTVSSDVIAEGRTAIPAGASAVGTVTKATKQSFLGIPARLELRVDSVTAPDGTLVPLQMGKASEGNNRAVSTVILSICCCFLFVFRKGRPATIPAGTDFIAATTAPTGISLP